MIREDDNLQLVVLEKVFLKWTQPNEFMIMVDLAHSYIGHS